MERCLAGVCLTALDPAGPKLFGFSEFLAGLALMILAWTIADVRYRFRVQCAPLPLQGLTFAIVSSVGVLTLLTDLWRVEGWPVVKGTLITPGAWQACLAALFLCTFLTWTWFAFIKPPAFSKRNAARYAKALYRFVLKAAPQELAVVADELTSSAPALVRHAPTRERFAQYRLRGEEAPALPKVDSYANDILLLIADKRFCKALVESAPETALTLFDEVGRTKRFTIPIGIFANNLVEEAIANRNSFLYHESTAYESGLLGHHKPLTQAMFSNYQLVEAVSTMFDADVWGSMKWDSKQWEAYCRIVLMTFRGYVSGGYEGHSYTLWRAFERIGRSVYDVYKLNGLAEVAWDNDLLSRLRVVITFITDTVKILDKRPTPQTLRRRVNLKSNIAERTFHDHIAKLITEVIFHVGAVKSPRDACWWIQHNTVWAELFNFDHLDSAAGRVVKFKVRRLLYDEIADLKRFPNYKGAKLLAFCLNVMGISFHDDAYSRDTRALHLAALSWTRKNFAWLYRDSPAVAEACLVDGTTYDVANNRLVREPQGGIWNRGATAVYLQLDPAPPP